MAASLCPAALCAFASWLARGDSPGAIEAFATAAEQAPDLATVHSQLANAHNAAGHSDAAIAACDAYLDRHPIAAA